MLRLKIIKLTRKPSQAATYLSTHALNCAKLNNKSAKVFRKKNTPNRQAYSSHWTKKCIGIWAKIADMWPHLTIISKLAQHNKVHIYLDKQLVTSLMPSFCKIYSLFNLSEKQQQKMALFLSICASLYTQAWKNIHNYSTIDMCMIVYL